MKNKTYFFFGVLLIAIISIFSVVPTVLEKQENIVDEHDEYDISNEAKALHETLIIGDWHADSLLWIRNISKKSSYGHVDLPRLREGNVALQMFTTVTKSPRGQNYVKNSTEASDNITLLALIQRWPLSTWKSLTARSLYQAEKLDKLAANPENKLMIIKSQSDLSSFFNSRKNQTDLVGGLLGTEGSHALDGNIDNINKLYASGFRMMSLQHFFDNKLGSSLHGTKQGGLTSFGVESVKRMNELEVIIDVSHSSEKVVDEVLSLSTRPLVVSHTGFKGHCDSPRNISDSLMLRIAKAGGLIAVGYWDGAVCGNTPDDIVTAIRYGIDLVGSQHVSLGSDYDGTVTTSFDTSELAVLTHTMLEKGFSEIEIRNVMGENMLKFLGENLPQ